MICFVIGATLGALQAWRRLTRFPGWLSNGALAVAIGSIWGAVAYGPVLWAIWRLVLAITFQASA
jgi:hypothetical protein